MVANFYLFLDHFGLKIGKSLLPQQIISNSVPLSSFLSVTELHGLKLQQESAPIASYLLNMYGIPEIFQLDNGSQYIAMSPKTDKHAIGYMHVQITSSPHYPRSNGFAERTVKTARAMLKTTLSPVLSANPLLLG